jgi:hypothetical protein
MIFMSVLMSLKFDSISNHRAVTFYLPPSGVFLHIRAIPKMGPSQQTSCGRFNATEVCSNE